MSDAYEVPEARRESRAPLVQGIRAEVDRWREQGYVGVSATSRRLLEHWFLDEHQTPDGQPFRYYFAQRESVETVIYLHEVARSRSLADLAARYATSPLAVARQPYPRYVIKAATGSGKTKSMGLLLAWSYFHALREPESVLSTTSLLVAPNLIVLERLREDFDNARIFREDPVVPPEWRSDFDLAVCIRDEPVPTGAPGVLALTNVQALYERRISVADDPVNALLGQRPPARVNAPESLLVRLSRRGRVLVVNDEAHHLHEAIQSDTGQPLVAIQTLQRLHELAQEHGSGVPVQLDFSATPKDQQGKLFPEIVADYPLAQAIEDGIVKRPIIGELSGDLEVTSDDASVRYRQRIGAGVAKWREFREMLAPAGRKPLLFVMAEDTTSADQIEAYLESLHDLQGRVLTLHVNMVGRNKGEIARGDLELARAAARQVDRDDSPYSAIVSVLMLREGWDVRNVSVIVPLRAYSAKANILPEQTLGRGLRRMTPPGSGVDEQVVIIEHEAFRQLWDDAIEGEDLDIRRRPVDDVHPEAAVIAVDPERLHLDIEIPSLTRMLTRDTSGIGRLRVADVVPRRLALPEVLRSDTVDYTGRDLLSGEIVERATYPFPAANDPRAVLSWFVNQLQHDTRVTGQFAALFPLVKGYIEDVVFDGPVSAEDPLVLQMLAEPSSQETILGALRQAVDQATLTTQQPVDASKPILLSATRPFLWSGETAAVQRSVFPLQPCDSGLEVQFCAFLDRCRDVAAFAKLAREVRFSLEYRGDRGRLAYYYPDFVVRTASGDGLVIETKGLVDVDVPRKDERAVRWSVDASIASGVRWRYLRVDEDLASAYLPRLSTVEALVDVVVERRQSAYLAEAPAPRARTRGEVLEAMRRTSERAAGADFNVDDDIRRMRDESRG